jgi:hypothetical protein
MTELTATPHGTYAEHHEYVLVLWCESILKSTDLEMAPATAHPSYSQAGLRPKTSSKPFHLAVDTPPHQWQFFVRPQLEHL